MAYADKDQLIADYIPDARSAAELAAVDRILAGVSAFVDTYCRRTAGYFAGVGATPGNKQKIRVSVSAAIQAPGNVNLTVAAAGLSGSPRTVSYSATTFDTSDTIAAGLRTLAAADSVLNAFFTITNTGNQIDLEARNYAANDLTMSATVFSPFIGGAVAVTTTNSTTLVTGSYNAPTEKRLRGEGKNFLRLPVHVVSTIEQVTLYGTVIDSALYYESDKNGWLYREDLGLTDSLWEEGLTYKVTARWGYAVTPLDLSEAVRQIVVAVWERQKGVLGEVTPNGFVIERAMPLFAREVLDRYKRREFEI